MNLRRQHNHGFTLLEVLIAMGVLSLVVAAIYSSWTAILRASKVGLESTAAVQRARIVIRVLEDSLGSTEAFAQNIMYYSFVAENGSEPTLSFVARLASSFPRSGKFGDFDVRRLTFSVEPGREGGKELVLRQVPIMMDMDDDEKEHPLVLAQNVKEFKTEFWDLRANDWIEEWTQTNQLPKLVRVTLQLADNPNSAQAREPIVRIVSLPAVMVQPGWQRPMMPGGPGQPGALPGQPGAPGQPGVPGQPGTTPNPNPAGVPGGNLNIPGQPGMLPGKTGLR